ncbi:MAG: pyridoxal phosphate-dependent aminotransferase [bacterium]
MDKINESGTIKYFSRVQKLLAEGNEIISLTIGELSDMTPGVIKDAGIQAIRDNHTRYTFNEGTLKLRAVIADKYNKEYGTNYTTNHVLVSNGSKHCLFNILFALCGAGDEVIIFSPFYPSYPEMVKLTGADPVLVETSMVNNFQPDLKSLENAISKRTRAIIINSPNNPTGAIYNEATLVSFRKIAKKNSLLLIFDEIYESLVFPPFKYINPLSTFPDMSDYSVFVSGVSKSFAMTGWRLGYCLGPVELIKKASLIQSHVTNNASSISQFASVTAIESGKELTDIFLPELVEKRNFVTKKLQSISGLKFFEPQGAFYFFIDVTEYLGRTYDKTKILTSEDLALFLLEQFGVAVVPGEYFGVPGFLRLSFAGSKAGLEKGCDSIIKGLKSLN